MTAAEFIQTLGTGGEARIIRQTIEGDVILDRFDDVRGAIIVENTRFDGQVRLSNGKLLDVVLFEECTFGRGLSLTDCRFEEGCWISNSEISKGCDLGRSDFAKDLMVLNARIKGDLHCDAITAAEVDVSRTAVEGQTDFTGANISGSARFSEATLQRGFVCFSTETGTKFGEDLLFHDATVAELFLLSTSIQRDLDCVGMNLAGVLSTHHKDSRPTKVGGNLYLNGAVASSGLALVGLKVKGNVELAGFNSGGSVEFLSIKGANEPAAAVDAVTSERPVAFEVGGILRIRDADIKGDLALRDAYLEGLLVSNCTIAGDFAIRRGGFLGTRISGATIVERTRIGGDFSVSGGDFKDTVHVRDLQIDRGMRFVSYGSNHPNFHSYLELTQLRVSGSLELLGVWAGDSEGGLLMQQLEVHGELRCRRRDHSSIRVKGIFALLDSSIGRSLDLTGLDVVGDLEIRRVEIHGDWNRYVHILEDTTISGRFSVVHTKVTGDADLSGVRCRGNVMLRSVSVDGDLFCAPRTSLPDEAICEASIEACQVRHLHLNDHFAKTLSLAHSRCAVLQLTGQLPFRLDLTGFAFESLKTPDDDLIGFLRCAHPFQRSNWHRVEKWLRDHGREEEATSVYLAMRRAERAENRRRRASRSGINRLAATASSGWNGILDGVLWFSLEPHRALAALVLLALVSILVFSQTGAVAYPRPGQDPSAQARSDGRRDSDQSTFPGFWVGLQQSVPMLKVDGVTAVPSRNPIHVFGRRLCTYSDVAGVIQLLGWLTIPLLLAAVTGIFKRARLQ